MLIVVRIEYLDLNHLSTGIRYPNNGQHSLDSAVTMSLTRVKILSWRVSQLARRPRFVVVNSIIFNIACKVRARVTIVEGSSTTKL
jgi:hypothetical protein